MECRYSRRAFLGATATITVAAAIPRIAIAAPGRDPRLIVMVLRGGLDGLAAVLPVGDPAFSKLREPFVEDLAEVGAPIPLDSFFALNPNLKTLAQLYQAGEATIVHAVSTPYRDRSHFDGQDVLESGLPGVAPARDGWLNRTIAALPPIDAVKREDLGLAIGYTVPLIMRGAAPVVSWAPQVFPEASDDTIRRLLDLYGDRDPLLSKAIATAADLDSMLSGPGGRAAKLRVSRRAALVDATETLARLMARDDGPRLATLSIEGWDTHAHAGPGDGSLGRLLSSLDEAFGRLKAQLGPVWRDTVVVAVTEFGRTAAINGTDGTDHGIATTAFLVGGALRGGRMLADWPGLERSALYEGRDLAPTTDLRAVLKGVLADHLGLSETVLAGRIFPQSAGVVPVRDLIRA